VKKKSQMFATAIIGRTVGVKYAIRIKVRPTIRSLTHTAIRSARAIENGLVPSANHRLLLSDCQKIGSFSISPCFSRPTKREGRRGRAVE
jgi:hypothetical protein